MQMRLLIIFAMSVCANALPAQAPINVWETKDVSFRTDKILIRDDKLKVIYEGLKDCSIDMSSLDNDFINASLTMKLSGYFEMNSGLFYDFSYKVNKDGEKKVSYTFKEGESLVTLQFLYDLGDTKPASISVAVSENILDKKSKMKLYVLSGIE